MRPVRFKEIAVEIAVLMRGKQPGLVPVNGGEALKRITSYSWDQSVAWDLSQTETPPAEHAPSPTARHS